MACLSILINRGFIIGDPAALPSKRKVCSVFCFCFSLCSCLGLQGVCGKIPTNRCNNCKLKSDH